MLLTALFVMDFSKLDIKLINVKLPFLAILNQYLNAKKEFL